MTSSYSTGQVAQALGVSEKAVRLYAARGLVPVTQDPRTGRRAFSAEALDRARSVGLLRAVGLPLADVAAGLSAADAISPHRMHVVDRPDGITVIDDSYNANPDSMRAALRALAVVAGRERRSVAVLGEMMELGEDARREHEAIGLQVVRLNVGLTVVVGPGALGIFAGAQREGSWGDEVVMVDDVDAATAFLERELRAGDVVLLKASNGAGLWRLGDLLTDTGVRA
jgi:UDP-N-acetylmuramoyl-tripeptide--D-alanyl-D-alanine ligase